MTTERREAFAWNRRREQPVRRALAAKLALLKRYAPRDQVVISTAWDLCLSSALPLDLHTLMARVGAKLPNREIPESLVAAARAEFLAVAPALTALTGGRSP